MKDIIRSYISDTLLSGADIANDDDLLLSGLLDSLSVIRLVQHLENEFAVRVPPEEIVIEHFTSVDTITAYLETKKAA